MSSQSIIRFLNPWQLKRERAAERIQALRGRDGDNCTRCRRPLRFDLPDGHDHAARIEPRPVGSAAQPLDRWCLCHTRCNAGMTDHTSEVAERLQRKAEAELLSKARRRKRKAA